MPIPVIQYNPIINSNFRDNDAIDEFFRQILVVISKNTSNVTNETNTKPIFDKSYVVRAKESDTFWNESNQLLDKYGCFISFSRGNIENEDKFCGDFMECFYDVRVRLPMDKNNRQRLIRIIDNLIYLLCENSNNSNQIPNIDNLLLDKNIGIITSVIDTDISNINPLKGKKYLTNLMFGNRIINDTRFEDTDETLNKKNYIVGGFRVSFRVSWSKKSIWINQADAESFEIY